MPELEITDCHSILIGSGFSRALEFPSVGMITALVRKMDGQESNALHALLETLEPAYSRALPNEWKAKQRPNYEEIFYYAESLSRAYADPAQDALVYVTKKEFHGRLEKMLDSECTGEYADGLLHLIRTSILDTVHESLNQRITSIAPLQQFRKMLRNLSNHRIKIFTTNHDLVLERMFKENGTEYDDGFSLTQKRVCLWDVDNLKRSIKPWLVKLHGSIDWRQDKGPNYYKSIIKVNPEVPGYGPPEILLGTLNKYFEYTQGIYSSCLALFADSLPESNKLVTIGYGFGDLGINNLIVNWLEGSKGRSVIVVSPNATDIVREFREDYDFLPTIMDYQEEDDYGNLKHPAPRIVPVDTRIENMCWDECRFSWN